MAPATAEMELSPGTRLGAYEIVAPIGAGGMGEVYRARDTKLGRDVAIKLLTKSVSTDAERRARFDREARTLASLNHPGIVTIFAVEQEGEHQFIAMELVEGRPLSEVVVRGGVKLDRLLAIAGQIAGAVAAAHKHGIVHRDLKPANVMVGPQDRVKVLDFGLAKLRAEIADEGETLLPPKDITGQGRILGTASYMSPEQAEGRSIDTRSDVFSLGVVLYEMATGERPFKGDTSMSVLSAILKDTPKPMTELSPAVPRELGRIVRRCLAKDPEDRYQSAADLRSDIEDLRQAALSGELRPVAGAHDATRYNRSRVAMAAVAVVMLVGLGWVATRPSGSVSVPPQLAVSRLTLMDGTAENSMLAPDGKWVVYVSAVSGNGDIYLQSTTGQTAINLTKDSSVGESTPAFSPDGEVIAFRSEREGGGLFVMGRTGESVRRLTRAGFQPAWFPDGKRLVFASKLANNPEARGGEVSELWTVDLAGGEPKRLIGADAVQPRVSPHGLRIAYWSMPSSEVRFTDPNRDIWTVTVDGTAPVRVTTDIATDWNPVWSPDGNWLYFLSNKNGSMNLWRIAIDESTGVTRSAAQPVTVPAAYIRHFHLSADGSLGVYSTLTQTNNLARVAFDAKAGTVAGAIQYLTSGPRDFGALAVSRDQRVVVASSARIQEDLFIVEGDGTGMRNITSDVYRDRNPSWMPDGRQIVFYSDRGPKNYEAWTVDRDGGGLRQLTNSEGRRFYPVSSPDGSKLITADINSRELFVYDTRDYSKPLQQLPVPSDEIRAGTNLQPSDWSPDGKLLSGSSGTLAWVYSFADRQYRAIGPFTAGNPTVQFLPDSRRLIVAGQGRLRIFDLATGGLSDLLAIPRETIGVARLSPDGSFLYFLHGASTGDVWLARFDAGATPTENPTEK